MSDNIIKKRDGVVTRSLRMTQVAGKPKRKSKKRKVLTGVPHDVVENTTVEPTVETKEG